MVSGEKIVNVSDVHDSDGRIVPIITQKLPQNVKSINVVDEWTTGYGRVGIQGALMVGTQAL